MTLDSKLYAPAMRAFVRSEGTAFARRQDAIAPLPGGIAAPH